MATTDEVRSLLLKACEMLDDLARDPGPDAEGDVADALSVAWGAVDNALMDLSAVDRAMM